MLTYFLHKMPNINQPWPDAVHPAFNHECSPRPSYKKEKWYLCSVPQEQEHWIAELPYPTKIVGQAPDSEIDSATPWLRGFRAKQKGDAKIKNKKLKLKDVL